MNIQEKAAQMARKWWPDPITNFGRETSTKEINKEKVDAFAAGAQFGYTASKWIEVKEGRDMPDSHEVVQLSCVLPTIGKAVLRGYWHHKLGWHNEIDKPVPENVIIDAWQALPEPFEKEEVGNG